MRLYIMQWPIIHRTGKSWLYVTMKPPSSYFTSTRPPVETRLNFSNRFISSTASQLWKNFFLNPALSQFLQQYKHSLSAICLRLLYFSTHRLHTPKWILTSSRNPNLIHPIFYLPSELEIWSLRFRFGFLERIYSPTPLAVRTYHVLMT